LKKRNGCFLNGMEFMAEYIENEIEKLLHISNRYPTP
jgi:hypothetical protein